MRWLLVPGVMFAVAAAGCETETVDPGDMAEGKKVEAGEAVTVQGVVERWVGLRTFKLNNLGPDFEEELVVISTEPLSNEVYDDVTVQVTGTIRKCDVEAIEEELGFDLPAEVEEKLQGVERCLVADLVQVIDAD